MLYFGRSKHTSIKNTQVKVEVLIQPIYSSKSEKVPAMKWTQIKKVTP